MYTHLQSVFGSEITIRKQGSSILQKIMVLALICTTPIFSFSQSVSITGVVFEKESTVKIENAIVAIEGTAYVEPTNENGEFIFRQTIPEGEHVVYVSKDGYEKAVFLINVVEGKKLVIDAVKMEMTKQEKKKRKKAEKEKESKIKDATKESEKQDKELAKEVKKLKKDKKGLLGILGKNKEPEVTIIYKPINSDNEVQEDEEAEVIIITPLQKKYAEILEVAPENITNIELYSFIDEWMGTPYLLGGETKAGIDCSSFTQRLYIGVYDWYIERTAQKQMDSEATHTWSASEFLEEGDFVFFRAAGHRGDTITHVGIYLGNDKFVNATSRIGSTGSSGVKISDLSEPYWKKRFFAGGRRVNTKS
ncbi:NlpC/P60 family protein [uncultured Zobellia sp.]|uniref:NlpC/P60 family protein n=1 Tax=uncultured Zobellia sp. TaxID=255433 RepID=UPI00259932EA|nr:NlpC/P60 family protein [uncultured Zobellia sp.]